MDKEKQLVLLGEKVKEYRKEKNLTQSQLAHAISKDREAISRLERGIINPSFLHLKEVCKGLGITLSELLNGF